MKQTSNKGVQAYKKQPEVKESGSLSCNAQRHSLLGLERAVRPTANAMESPAGDLSSCIIIRRKDVASDGSLHTDGLGKNGLCWEPANLLHHIGIVSLSLASFYPSVILHLLKIAV